MKIGGTFSKDWVVEDVHHELGILLSRKHLLKDSENTVDRVAGPYGLMMSSPKGCLELRKRSLLNF